MLLRDSDVRLSADEMAALFGLPRSAVDLILKQRLPNSNGRGTVAANDVEALLNGWLVRLYHAVDERKSRQRGDDGHDADDERSAGEPSAVDARGTTELEITHSLAEFEQSTAAERANLRLVPRYVPRRPLLGNYRQTGFSVLQISATGVRIRHDETLRPGDEAKVTIALDPPGRPVVFRARVVWTSIAQRGDGPSFCISGLRATANEVDLRLAVAALAQKGELTPENVAPRKSDRSAAPLAGLSDDDVASIIRVTRMFNSNPNEAERWYARGRSAMSDDAIRRAAPPKTRDREEVLGIWEFLDRRIDIEAITGVVNWIRRARSAGAAADPRLQGNEIA